MSSLTSIGGNANFSGSQVRDLSSLESVKSILGSLSLKNRIKHKLQGGLNKAGTMINKAKSLLGRRNKDADNNEDMNKGNLDNQNNRGFSN